MFFPRAARLIVPLIALTLGAAVACGGDGDPAAQPADTPVPTPTRSPAPNLTPTGAPTAAPAPASTPIPPTATATVPPSPTAAPTPASQAIATPRPPTPTPQPATAPAPTPTASATPVPPTATPAPTAPPSQANPSLAQSKALVLAAEEFGVPSSALTVQSIDPIVWPNTALGCEVPGELYAQRLVPGYVVIVTDGTASREYHADEPADEVISCALAEQIASLPSINLVEQAGLANTTAIIVSALPPGNPPVEFVRVEDAARIAIALDALAGPTYLTDATACTPLFMIEFVTPAGTVVVQYACSGAGELVRGAQPFWGGKDGIVAAAFQAVINQALAAREFPAFPPEP